MPKVELYEIKLLLEPASVFANEGPIESLELRPHSPLGNGPKVRRMTVSFLDSDDERLRQAGWSIRLRRDLKAGGELKASYKKRFKVAGSSDADLEETLARASSDFPQGLGNGQFELDWGRERRTLSAGFPGYEGVPISLRDAAVDELPDVLEDQRATVAGAREFGPVTAIRWSAASAAVGQKLELELWRLPTPGGGHQDVLEVSFEEADRAAATEARPRLLEAVDQAGWELAHVDLLKTELLFAAFRA